MEKEVSSSDNFIKKRIKNLLIWSLLFVVAVIVYYVLNKYLHFTIPCVFYLITKKYCPGCGITRMFFSIVKFDFYQAFRYNPWVFCLLIGAIVFNIVRLIRYFVMKKDLKCPHWLAYSALGLTIVYWVLRNIPALEYLAPTIVRMLWGEWC